VERLFEKTRLAKMPVTGAQLMDFLQVSGQFRLDKYQKQKKSPKVEK
jgi:hypothetical protein